MLGELPWYGWHVGKFLCEDIAISAWKVGELAFLFGQELGHDPYRLGWVGGVNSHRLGFLKQIEGRRGGWFVVV